MKKIPLLLLLLSSASWATFLPYVSPSTATVGAASGTIVNTNGLVVSSTSWNTPYSTDGHIAGQTGDVMGRTFVSGCPFGVLVSSYSIGIATMTSRTTNSGAAGTGIEGVLISSGTAPNPYFNLVGCVFANTSSTATVIIESPTSTIASRLPIGLAGIGTPPQGLPYNCVTPWFRSAPFSETYMYVKGTASAGIQQPITVDMRCVGYYSPL